MFENLSIDTILNNLTVGIAISDQKGKFIYINDLITEITGYSMNDLDDIHQWFQVAYDDSSKREKIRSFFEERLKNGKEYSRVLKIITKYGKEKHVEFRIKPLNGGYFLANLIDISHKIAQRKKIEYLSFHDELTGVYNRHYLKNEIEKLNNSRKYPISIIIGDLDNLKKVNDNYGHLKGDQYIKKAANIIKNLLREEDIIARVGGDEFVILLPETSKIEAEKISNRIEKKVYQQNLKIDLPVELKISLGSSTSNNKDEDLYDCYEKADKKMYQNKKS